MTEDMIIVGVGAGRFLVEAIAQSLQLRYTSLISILGHVGQEVEICLPAYAVATLYHQMDVA